MNTFKILVVDDEKNILKIMARLLRPYGTIIQASNGQEALTLLEKESWQVDLVITDLTMPKMDGLQLIERIHATCCDLPIIVISGQYQTAPPAGIQIIGKPWQDNELLAAVDQHLQKNKTRN
ncbi:MAG: response regulator [Candidatus Buchananbacteria bacterium]|nr:response regulator [Candidatus Buchananbacteria bacterium]